MIAGTAMEQERFGCCRAETALTCRPGLVEAKAPKEAGAVTAKTDSSAEPAVEELVARGETARTSQAWVRTAVAHLVAGSAGTSGASVLPVPQREVAEPGTS